MLRNAVALARRVTTDGFLLHVRFIARQVQHRVVFGETQDIAGHGIATRDEHVAFKPTACQTRDYAISQNWI